MTSYDPLGLVKTTRTQQLSGTKQARIFDREIPQKELDKATSGALSKDQREHNFWDELKDLANPNNGSKKRTNEALMCMEQKNTKTNQTLNHEGYFKGEPSAIPLDRPFPPSPDNLGEDWVCTKVRFRPGFNGGPPPGL